MRLDRYLHEAGLGSRREVGGMIREGRVAVGGAPARSGAEHVAAGSAVTLDGAIVALRGPRVVAYHKPAGLVTSTRDRLPTVYAQLPFSPDDLRPVGRLDRETEGLLLLTDDGLLLHRLTSPRWHVEKEYLARVDGEVGSEALARLRAPLPIGRGALARGAKLAERAEPGWLRLVVDEGKYHQVRRMCAAVSLRVVALRRVRVATIALGDLAPGSHRELSREEDAALRREVGLPQSR